MLDTNQIRSPVTPQHRYKCLARCRTYRITTGRHHAVKYSFLHVILRLEQAVASALGGVGGCITRRRRGTGGAKYYMLEQPPKNGEKSAKLYHTETTRRLQLALQRLLAEIGRNELRDG